MLYHHRRTAYFRKPLVFTQRTFWSATAEEVDAADGWMFHSHTTIPMPIGQVGRIIALFNSQRNLIEGIGATEEEFNEYCRIIHRYNK